jgi:transposase-like protein
MTCLYCKGRSVKFGVYNKGKQRYKCLKCGKTFSDGTVENTNAAKHKRLVFHLILAGCGRKEIAKLLSLEEKTIQKWLNTHFRGIKEFLPAKPLLRIGTLKTIYSGIEKSRIAKNQPSSQSIRKMSNIIAFR